jgi:UDP-N-acetyl-2-amino-2-deoxyglucuronate dehydrogenase
MTASRPRSVRYGIVGTGMIARIHAAAIAAAKDSVLVAVHDTVPERAAAFAREFNVPWDSDLQAFLARPDLDAVTLATPSGARADVAVPAALAGKHILCEKPLEVTLERVDRIVAAAERAGVILACVFQARTVGAVKRLRHALDEQRLGRLLLADVQVPWYRTQEYYDSSPWRGTWELDGGGALMNQSIHIIDLLLHFLGEPASVMAFADTLAHERIDVEDTAVAAVRFKSGTLATIAATTGAAPGFPRRLEICGTKGSVVLLDERLERWCIPDAEMHYMTAAAETSERHGNLSGAGDPAAISADGHQEQIEDLTRAILAGGAPMVCGREARRAVELILGIYESARSGRPFHFS